MSQLNRPRRKRTSIKSLKRKLSGKDDSDEGRKNVFDFILELNFIPKCVYSILKIRIRKTPLFVVREEIGPTDEELREIEASFCGLSPV